MGTSWWTIWWTNDFRTTPRRGFGASAPKPWRSLEYIKKKWKNKRAWNQFKSIEKQSKNNKIPYAICYIKYDTYANWYTIYILYEVKVFVKRTTIITTIYSLIRTLTLFCIFCIFGSSWSSGTPTSSRRISGTPASRRRSGALAALLPKVQCMMRRPRDDGNDMMNDMMNK